MPDFWMDNAMTPGKHILVDLGYWADAGTRFLDLSKLIGRSNFQRVGNDRLVARIPPRRVEAVLAALPQIVAGAAKYCWCTHGFINEQPPLVGMDMPADARAQQDGGDDANR